jgi:hypothetical protein
MGIKKTLKHYASQVTTSINHYSDENSDRSRDIKQSLDDKADKLDTKTGAVSEGKASGVGSMRLVSDKELYYLEFKTKDGWIRSDNTSVSGFSFKSK